MPESKTSEKRLNAAQKRAEALKLRTSGMKFEDIRDRLGYRSVSSAHEAVMKGLRDTLQEPADELRKMEAERLDRLMEAIWADATQGNEWKIDRVLNIMERRARLLGLDKPPERDVGDEAQKYLDLLNMARQDATDLSE